MNFISNLKYLTLICFTCFCFFKTDFKNREEKPRLLVFSKTKGWHHTSIPFGISAIKKIAEKEGYLVDTTTNSSLFNDENLKQYQAVIFNCTTGNVLNGAEQAAFERYIQAGGGYVGIHSAADTEYDWPWYGQLAGAYFDSHPHNSNIREAVVQIKDKNHPATAGLPERWKRTDEWYNYRSYYPGIKILASLDEQSYEGGTNGSNHAIAWYHEFDGGRAFYTGLGHTDESYADPLFIGHLAGGVKYAIGDHVKLDYSKSYAKAVPEQNRFVKTILKDNLNSPMEIAAADDGRIFFTELFGNLSVFDTKTGKSSLVYKLPISNVGGTGLIGIALDPKFASNGFVYLYYAPGGQIEEPINFQLSRFNLSKANVLDLASEKVMLKVPVQKNSGSHHGGSLAFDANGNLFLSTGDSSSPFPSDGYAPLDERSDQASYSGDSQRSSGNTNDFKGKILRIHPEADGTYSIPEGNLFPKGTAKTKPEIYVMGTRNPYRIAVNPKTAVLYWGEVGPDAGIDSKRGPMGYDEVNQAKKAGNYGWPYFIANNKAYAHWDFTTKTAGEVFNPEKPVNNSPNNTGLNNLPPAQSAMIWYPYSASKEFPELGIGGRCIIGGTFYEYKKAGSPNRFPEYYDGSLFIADWMRNWVFALRFDENENYKRNEPFMVNNGKFKRPIDMTFSADGVMYMLEYGSVYGAANPDASLVKIEYNAGNRKPLAKAVILDQKAMDLLDKSVFLTSERKGFKTYKSIAGQAPLKVDFSGKNSLDYDDDDDIKYQWYFDGKNLGSTTADASFVYKKPGIYKAVLKVTDRSGAYSKDTVVVKVGNTPPVVEIASSDNKSFFESDKPFHYTVKVSDRDEKKVNPLRIKAFYQYQSEPAEAAKSTNQAVEQVYSGKALLAASDCKSCHQANAKAIGPSYFQIADRYKSTTGSVDQLAEKIIKGGGGNWSKTNVMSAHPQLSPGDAKEIVKYIFSLTDKKKNQEKIALAKSGELKLPANKEEPQGAYTFFASYKDQGTKATGMLTSVEEFTLRNALMNPAFADAHPGFERFRNSLAEGSNKSYLLFNQIDLTGIKKFTFNYASKDLDGEIEVRMDSRAGPVISKVSYSATGSFDKFVDLESPLVKAFSGRHNLYFIMIRKQLPDKNIIKLNTIRFGL
jgi:cytochrome c